MLVMHAGPHKTATSYLQKHFWRDRSELASRNWLYPDAAPMASAQAHHDLAHDCQKYLGHDPERTADLTRIGRSYGRNILLSSEGFRVWLPGHVVALQRYLGRDEVEVIYVVRDPMRIFYSYWAEEVKQGYSISLPERFSEHFGDPYRSPILNPLVDLNRFRLVPGIRLRVVPFDVLSARGVDLYEHICTAVLKINPPVPADRQLVNPSYPIELTEFLRLLTRLQGGSNQIIGPEFRMRFNATYSAEQRQEIIELVRSEGAPARRAILFSNENTLRIAFEQMLKKALRKDWTCDPGDQPLFLRTPMEMVYYDSFELWQRPAIRDRVEDVWKTLVS